MRLVILFLTILAFLRNANTKKLDFSHHRVYRVVNLNEDEVSKLQKLESNQNYTFWSDIQGQHPVDVMVPPDEERNFLGHFPNAELYIHNVQDLIDKERPAMKMKSMNRTGMTWDDYYTYEEINNWLQELTEEFPDKVTLVNIGKSFEGRSILGVHVSFNKDNANKGILLEAGIHAREWIGVATVTYQLNELLRSQDPDIRRIAEAHDWYIFPIYNPDGYVFTFTRNRMWRKTRQRHGLCIGADPNRNWDFKWHEGDYNYVNSCSESYAGPRAFSEPETRQIAAYIKTIGSKLIGYISHHAYSQLLLIPYGDSSEHRDNFDELYAVALKMTKKIEEVHGVKYTPGNIVEILYKATGNDLDWVKHNFKTRMTYVYELRDKGRNGFLLPADQIIPTGEEILAGLVTMLDEFQKIDEMQK